MDKLFVIMDNLRFRALLNFRICPTLRQTPSFAICRSVRETEPGACM